MSLGPDRVRGPAARPVPSGQAAPFNLRQVSPWAGPV